MKLEELKSQSNVKVLLEGESGRGKTRGCSEIALEVSGSGGNVLYIDTEQEGATTIVNMVESDDIRFDEEDLSGILYEQIGGYSKLSERLESALDDDTDFDLVIIDSLDHKHSYVLKHVTDSRKESDADWNQYPSIYSEEKEMMETIGKPGTNVIATIDPDSGSRDKPKGAQTNIRGYFSVVIKLHRTGDEWASKVVNWVGHGDQVGEVYTSLNERLAEEITERM